ncbi:periplasmic protein, partial [Salmonella enterica subsp. enterica serovar Heidelberg str. 41563]
TVRLASRQYGKRSIQLVRSLLLQSDIYQWLGKPELTPQIAAYPAAITYVIEQPEQPWVVDLAIIRFMSVR